MVKEKSNKNIDAVKKAELFEKLINIRVTNALKELEKIGKCSDTSRYSYDKTDIFKIFRTLSRSLRMQQEKFEAGLKLGQEIEFKLK
jgi:hypothetical protein